MSEHIVIEDLTVRINPIDGCFVVGINNHIRSNLCHGFRYSTLKRKREARYVVSLLHAFERHGEVALVLAQVAKFVLERRVLDIVDVGIDVFKFVAQQMLYHSTGVALAGAEGTLHPYALALAYLCACDVDYRLAQHIIELLSRNKTLPG